MSYHFRKKQVGQEVVKKVIFYLNACKYTQPDYRGNNAEVEFSGAYSSSFTGVTVTDASPTKGALWGGSYFYLYTQGEYIKCTISGGGVITIVARGQLGTTAYAIVDQQPSIMYHRGEAEGSCYGYSQTCINSDSYSETALKPLVFSSAPLASGNIYHGGLDFNSVSYDSAEIKAGESIGSRSRLSFKIKDQSHNGYDTVFYPARRTNQGTLFGKLLAAHPYFGGRLVGYSVGLRDSGTLDEPEWEARNFIIDSVNLDNGEFSGSGLDSLILTEGKKAKMPLASPAQLTVAITGASTSISFGNAPVGYFGSSGNIIVRVDSELLQVTANGTATMPIVTRGFGHSEVKDHSVNATVQNCLRFIDEHVVDCITYALSTWTNLPADALDDYSSVIALTPTAIISDYTLSSPMDVFEFINRCIVIGNLVVYFDDVVGKLVIKYISEFSLAPVFVNESDHIKLESVKKQANSKEHYTRFNLSWAPWDQTKETDAKNQQISLTTINAPLESPQKTGEVNEKKSLIIPMLNDSTDDYLLGAAIISRVVNTQEAPDIFECELDAEQIGDAAGGGIELGSIVSLFHSDNQTANGDAQERLYQVVKMSGDPFESFKVKMRRWQLFEPDYYDFVIEPGLYINYVLTDHFDPSTAGEYVIYVKAGSVFGSFNTSVFAFDTGTPNAGVTFKIVMRGQVLGMGGAGADADIYGTVGTIGQNGGGALVARCNITLDLSAGLLFAGGGGGGAGTYWQDYDLYDPYYSPSSGGSGGQGFGDSLGGLNSSGSQWDGSFWIDPVYDGKETDGAQSSAGLTGLHGGAWGEQGQTGFTSGGISGEAIKSNGYTVTIIAGDNPLTIRGRRT